MKEYSKEDYEKEIQELREVVSHLQKEKDELEQELEEQSYMIHYYEDTVEE